MFLVGILAAIVFLGGWNTAFPNLIAILLLSGVVVAMHKKNGDPDTEDGNSVMLKGEGVE